MERFSINDSDNLHVIERLVILSEECSEVTRLVSKILRFGIESKYPGDSDSNQEQLEYELGDLLQMVDEVIFYAQLDPKKVEAAKKYKVKRLCNWLRQPVPPVGDGDPMSKV